MRGICLPAAALAAVMTMGLAAQGAPSIAGKWTLVPDPAAAAPGGGGGGRGGRGGGGGGQFCGNECTIEQDAMSVTVTRATPAGEQKAVYKLDGSESKNMQAGRGGAQTEVVSKAMVEGNTIVISTTRDFGGNSVTTKTAISMSGDQMVLENTADFGQGPNTTKQTYKKN